MKSIMLILSLSFGLIACAPTPRSTPSAVHQFEMGQPIDPAKVNQITEGKTTEQEAINLLGAPQTIQERPDGSKILVFSHYQTRMAGPSFSSTQGAVSNEMLFLGIRNGLVMKKWQRTSQQPMKSFTGWTNTPPNQ
jgi:hypothetical protein